MNFSIPLTLSFAANLGSSKESKLVKIKIGPVPVKMIPDLTTTQISQISDYYFSKFSKAQLNALTNEQIDSIAEHGEDNYNKNRM